MNKPNFWSKVENQNILPERSADSMKAFWKKYQDKRLEDFLIESVFQETDFCLSFKEIPNPDFLAIFKAKHESEFRSLN